MASYELKKLDDKHYVVVKNGEYRYNILFKKAAWSCDCPARKSCKHLAMLPPEVQVKRYPRDEITDAYNKLLPYFYRHVHDMVGSYRRGSKDSKDIDIIILCNIFTFDQLMLNLRSIMNIISAGSTKIHGTIEGIPVDIDRVDEVEHYAAHLLYRTGPASLNIKMRQLAKDRGFILNEHVIANSEEEIFRMVNMCYIKPEDRA